MYGHMCVAIVQLGLKPTVNMAIPGKHLQVQASMYQLHGANIYKLLDNISGGTPTNRVGFPLDHTLIVLYKALC